MADGVGKLAAWFVLDPVVPDSNTKNVKQQKKHGGHGTIPDTFLFFGVWGFRFGADNPEPVYLDR